MNNLTATTEIAVSTYAVFGILPRVEKGLENWQPRQPLKQRYFLRTTKLQTNNDHQKQLQL